MEKKKIEKWMKILSKVVIFGGIIAILASVHSLYNTLHLYLSGTKPEKFFKEANKNLGTIAEILGIAAGSLWVIRTGLVEMKKRKLPFGDLVQQLFLLLKKHHIHFGVITLILALAHGVYFFLYVDERHKWTMYSGIVAYISLVFLALLGWRHVQNKKNKQTKKMHVTFALIFGVLFLIHLYI